MIMHYFKKIFIKIPYYLSQCCVICRFKQLYLDNHSQLDTCSYELLFLTVTGTIISQNIDLSS